MADLETLKTKYRSVLDLISQKGVQLHHVHIANDKLYIEGAAPTEDIKNDVWNAIKHVDSSYSDLTANITVDSSLPAPAQAAPAAKRTHTIKPGDTLTAIALHYYGKASEYTKIVAANPDTIRDPNNVRVGTEITIPE